MHQIYLNGYGADAIPTVIRLKQVEHIKNERTTLSAVAGHPFITTMLTSFADKDNLYMLVRNPIPSFSNLLTSESSTTALEAKSSPTYDGPATSTRIRHVSMLQKWCCASNFYMMTRESHIVT